MGGHRRGLAGGHRSARGERPLFGHAKEWNKIRDFERVVAYAFRGDKREPAAIKAAGGFHPPSTRTDPAYVQKIAEKFVAYMQQRFNRNVTVAEATSYIRGQGRAGKDFVEYELWRMILDREQLHVGRMIRNEFLKGYISTTRDIYTATNFVEEDGWVYLVHTVGGLLVPPLGGHQWAICQEHEIAHPGPLPWRSVVGFRRCGGAGKTVLGLSGPVFLRRGFERREPQAFQQAFDVLSGGDQG